MGKAPRREGLVCTGGSWKSWWPIRSARQGGAVKAMTLGEPHPFCREQKASGKRWSREIIDSCCGKI